ncbi:hypothetical protein ABBQ32_14142 [Trebouxia sp. C0010 RCD-2024]
MNLIVGSYLKLEYGAAEALKQAFDIINWWKWHLVPFSWLLAEMDHPLALLTGCLTRWGSQVAALIRLLQFKEAMQVVLGRRKQEILDMLAKKEQRTRASDLFHLAQSDYFWLQLADMIQKLLPVRIAVRVLEADSARLDDVLEQFGRLANHFSYSTLMTHSLEKRWFKMDHKLFLLAYVLHPARHLQHINPKLEFAYTTSLAQYAKEMYQRLFPCTAEEGTAVYKQMAVYLAKGGAFSSSIPEYQDSKENPDTFWCLMTQPFPHLTKLADHLFTIAVNSAAVDRLFSDFGNIQTQRRSSLVHDRVHKLATIKSMLPRKPRSKAKAAGGKYLSRQTTRASKLSGDAAQAALAKAARQTQQQYVDGPEDIIVDRQQMDDLVQEYQEQVEEDEADDADFAAIPGVKRCRLSDLFVDMPAFDMDLLFEDDLGSDSEDD